jgi:hypothetical protein
MALWLLLYATEVRMVSSAGNPLSSLYRVEVSGWDDQQDYFVEKSELEWSEDRGKQVTLTRKVRAGAMVFVRLLQSPSPDRSQAVAYRAEFVGTAGNGQYQFQLEPVRPQISSEFPKLEPAS